VTDVKCDHYLEHCSRWWSHLQPVTLVGGGGGRVRHVKCDHYLEHCSRWWSHQTCVTLLESVGGG
jgi:hypothetical protein